MIFSISIQLSTGRDQTISIQLSTTSQGSNNFNTIIYNRKGIKQFQYNYLQPHKDQTISIQLSRTSQGSNNNQLVLYKFREIN
jgi:hypothetical protein